MANSVRVGIDENNDVFVNIPVECNRLIMTPDQSRQLAKNLINFADEAEKSAAKGYYVCPSPQRLM